MKNNILILIPTIIAVFAMSCNNNKNQAKMTSENNTSIFPKGEPLSKEWFTGNAFITPLIAKDKNYEFQQGQ